MDIDSHLLFNFVPLTATILTISVALTVVLQRLKWRWRIYANCWFCNHNTKIYRQQLDWWQCSSCEQFNGFSKDGDYNYQIPEQRIKSLNNPAKLYSSPVKNESFTKKKGLCTTCNRNEELKLCELRSIDSSKWRESEIQIFKKNLEEKYPLCKKCNTFVKKILQKQSLWLTQYKMLAFKHKPMKMIVNNRMTLEKFCRILLTLLSAGVIYSPTHQTLPIISALLQLTIAIAAPISRKNFDLLLTLLWVGIGVLTPFNHSILLKPNLKLTWVSLEYISGYQITAVLSLILGFTNISSKNSLTANTNMSFKKLDSPITTNNDYSMPKIPNDIDHCINEDNDVVESARRSPVNITHLLTTPTPSFDSAPSIKSTILSPNIRICDSQRSTSSTSFPFNNNQIDILQSSPKSSTAQSYSKKNYLNESLKTLSSLSLSEKNQKQILKNPKIFETKLYGTTSSDIFRRNYKTTGRKFVLAPPKLKSVSQNSWVAGGYWQTGMDSPTLSRSSSQSSGFGSAGSIFGPSREPSVVNDVDRCSIMSDVTQCCHNSQRQSSISPLNLPCQRKSSPIHRLGGSEHTTSCMVSPTTNMMMTASLCGQTVQPSFCHSYHMNDQCLQNRNMNFNMIQRNPEMLPCINYPSTILTNPILLPALLCGSLVFNMVVFCTVLLR